MADMLEQTLTQVQSWLVLLERTGDGTPAAPPRFLPHPDTTRAFSGFDSLPPTRGPRQLGTGLTLLAHHPQPTPPTGGSELTVMTYNILLGGERRERLLGYFDSLQASGRMPDVLGLQEASQPTAVELARRYGFHLAYYGQEGNGLPLVNGKAWLSRFPLREATHFTYALPEPVRRAAIARRGQPGELVEDRGALRALVEVHGQPLLLFNVHHTLGDSGINTSNLRQLLALVQQRGSLPTVVLGDFNANIHIRRQGAWLPSWLRRYESTSSVAEYLHRYGFVLASVGDPGVGNIADPRLRRTLLELERELPEVFARAHQVYVRRGDGEVMTPEEARRRLRSGRVPRHSEAWRRLQDVADAATLHSLPDERGVVPATGKRFDTLYATRQLEPTVVEVDGSTEASDHLPVVARFHLP